MNYVYILKCSDESLYTGWTTDLKKRFKEHAQGKGAKYTRSRRPLELVYQEELSTSTKARQREAVIKKLSRREKLLLIQRQRELLALAEKKLKQWGRTWTQLAILREKQEIVLFRVKEGEKAYVLKLFLSSYGREELMFYSLFQKIGIPSLTMIQGDDEAFLLQDLDQSPTHRLALKEEMQDPVIMRQLGSWYRQLHSLEGHEDLNFPRSKEWAHLSGNHFEKLKGLLHEYWSVKRIETVVQEIKTYPLRVCYNDFYYENMVVSMEEPSSFMMDYGLMGINYPGVDLVNALWFSSEKAKTAFREGYGLSWEKEERRATLLLLMFQLLEVEPGGEGFMDTLDKIQDCLNEEKSASR